MLAAGCGAGETQAQRPQTQGAAQRSGTADETKGGQAIEFAALSGITPLDEKQLTVMVYMNGSDLESEYGAGSEDIAEMIASGYDEERLNVVLFTGGSHVWWRDDIPDDVNTVFFLRDGELVKVADAGEASMGDPQVLAGFVRLARQTFPARQYGLVLWNHGGGAVVGFGADERFEHMPDVALMKLADIGNALDMAGLGGGDKLEFLGFDTCLMATIEMAKIAGAYAHYFIASEEVEPEQGWDYAFLGDIRPNDGGREIGEHIVRRYAEFYVDSEWVDLLTMSVTDLSKVGELALAFEGFALAAGDALKQGEFRRLSKARRSTRNFGSGGEDGESDMVDIREMARLLEGTIDRAVVRSLKDALETAVIVNYTNFDYRLGGLAVYYPFFNKEGLDDNLRTYAAMNKLPNYTAYIMKFAEELQRPRIFRRRGAAGRGQGAEFALTQQEAANAADIRLTTWQPLGLELGFGEAAYKQVGETPGVMLGRDREPHYAEELYLLDGRPACLYADGAATQRRTIPAVLHGDDVNIIVRRDTSAEGGWRIVGAVPTSNGAFNTVDRKMVRLRDGDTLALRYYVINFDEHGSAGDHRAGERWITGEEFTVRGEPRLTRGQHTDGLNRKLNLIDHRNNNYFIPVS